MDKSAQKVFDRADIVRDVRLSDLSGPNPSPIAPDEARRLSFSRSRARNMRNIHDVMVMLFPSPFSPCSFRRRLFAALVTWGIPLFLAEFFYLRLYRYPSEFPIALALQVPSIVVGALGIALLEHLIYFARSMEHDRR